MFAKIQDNQVIKYPYTVQDLRNDNPDVGFGSDIPDEMWGRFGAVRVIVTGQPERDPLTQDVIQITPAYIPERNRWEQQWQVVDVSDEEAAARLDVQQALVKARREQAYREESDPLYFQEQRGDVPLGTWLAKIAEIKARYPS